MRNEGDIPMQQKLVTISRTKLEALKKKAEIADDALVQLQMSLKEIMR